MELEREKNTETGRKWKRKGDERRHKDTGMKVHKAKNKIIIGGKKTQELGKRDRILRMRKKNKNKERGKEADDVTDVINNKKKKRLKTCE